MMWFVSLLNESGNEAVGSFGNVVIDGRLSRDNAENEAHRILSRERKVSPWYVGFSLQRGSRWSDCKEVKRFMMHPDSINALKEMRS